MTVRLHWAAIPRRLEWGGGAASEMAHSHGWRSALVGGQMPHRADGVSLQHGGWLVPNLPLILISNFVQSINAPTLQT